MFGHDRDGMRRYYLQCWKKFQQKQPLDALEQQVAQVIAEHPEYHKLLEQTDAALQRDYLPENGETNPFLHMGLHLGIREQASTNRPTGISELYRQLVIQYGTLDAEHRMMDCLAESIWLAQRNQTAPDEAAYLDCLKKASN
ncbi:MAG: DUF1841 family protein [Thiothrix sp.]